MNALHKDVAAWWHDHLGHYQQRADHRALRARLRRAAGPLAVVGEPAVHDLVRAQPWLAHRADVLADIVLAIAHVDRDGREPLARALGKPPGGDSPVMSPLRFERLMASSRAELAPQIRRALAQAENTCNVGALAADLAAWDDPERGEAVRLRWWFAYYNARPAQMSETSTDHDNALHKEQAA
ncbi:type I-E CRISPR-associated protein Cse2/CasB [Novosphingobium sp. FSW06-99]|uniref:type I-E CRISPR-associated protein Cse2/CasB n=1 Tax=Novosphingobium sp. FSW06-99 TaxID=1739113 RepID=UPI00076C2EC6|nr:type I-E CRISPR-associated protein Cse2/CasB [Novosphingobium sp. FSW06-99]KUR78629.1 hypothetical protein AQZ49_07230 [Novosphingobium sp. FSW06-99]